MWRSLMLMLLSVALVAQTRTFSPTLRQTSPTPLSIAQVDGNFSGTANVANSASRSYFAGSQASMLALSPTPQAGDWCWRSDTSFPFIFLGGDATSLSNWATLPAYPSIPVSSVFGRTGTVTAQSGDYSVGQVTGALPSASPVFTGDMIKGAGPSFADYNTSDTRTTINRHGFEDHNILNTTDTGLGYAAFDAQPTLNNTLNQDHLVGFQSRPIYTGSADLNGYLHGLDAHCAHNGSGTVYVHRAAYLQDVSGTGPVQNSYGLAIGPITRGSVGNYAIYLSPTNTGNAYLGVARVIMDNSTASSSRLTGSLVTAGGIGALGVWADTVKADTLIQSSGGFVSVTTTADNAYFLRSSAGYRRYFAWQTGTSNRWLAECGSTAESGSDAGSPWTLGAYTDAGALIDYPLNFLRKSAGAMTFGGSTLRPAVFTGPMQFTSKAKTNNGATTTFTFPAGTLYQYLVTSAASLQVTLPATSAALDGAVIDLVLSANVGTLTWVAGSGGATIVGAPAAGTANTPIRMIYHHATTEWLPF